MPADTQPPVVTPAPVIPPATPGTDLGKSTPEDFEKANTALDDLLKAAAVPDEDEPAPDEPVAPPAAPAEPAAPVAPPAPDPATPPPVVPPARAADEFDKVEIPPHLKPKSVEAFDTVKTIARERIAAIEKERAELATKLAAAEESAKAGPSPETQKELEELRKFRLSFDVEADPSFKTWDKTVKENEDLIYTRLKTAGFTEENLKTIRDLGGPGMVDWDAIKDKINPTLKRYIEGKVFENEDLAEKKKQAVEKAKGNAAEFVKTRQEEIYNNTEGRQKATKAEFDAMLPKFEWLNEKPIPATAKPEEKAKLEAENAFTKKIKADVQEALTDDSPAMRAILIAGFAQLMKVRADLETVKASHSAELAKLTAAIAEKDAFIARIKKSSTARLTGKGSSGDPAPAPKSSVNEEPVDALDRHLKEALAKLE